ncbi:MAG TPA: phosphoribosylformylglycinamidine synthase subunit PurQ [Saprospiraceae bacterium]|nr:phosphoribosylformylglycinamidine synthase subunit PurQ [Saprospiraceae bacterium]
MAKYGVIVFPGSNCDDDLIHVLGSVFGKRVEKIWHKESQLPNYGVGDCIFIPGGFSYGDYLRCGAIARFSPVMNDLIRFANEGGYVIGICNGFQILCEAGLLPGQLLPNHKLKFMCKNVFLKTETKNSPISSLLDLGTAYKIPIAHADGRYYADQNTLTRLVENDQIIFKYCDQNLQINDDSNVNGSCLNIAGICNENRNVCGMMPHPERASEAVLGNEDGRLLFESLFAYIKEHHFLIA